MSHCEQPCPKCYANIRRRENNKGHKGYKKPLVMWRIEMARATFRKPSNGSGGRPDEPWKDPQFEASYPYLAGFLAQDSWPEGEARETGTLLFFVDAGALKACLNDRDGKRSVFITAPSFKKMLDLIEEGLEQDNHVWRAKK